jgi:hypothetical protein
LYKLLATEQIQQQQQHSGAQHGGLPRGASVRPITIAGVGTGTQSSGSGKNGLTEMWDRLVKGYLQEQYSFYVDLSRYCEHLLRASCRAGPEGVAQGALDAAQDLLDRGIERVRFLAPVQRPHAAGYGVCCTDMLCLHKQRGVTGGSGSVGVPVKGTRGHSTSRAPLVSVLNVLSSNADRDVTPALRQSTPSAATAAAKGGSARASQPSGKENRVHFQSDEVEPPPPPPPPLPVQRTNTAHQPEWIAPRQQSAAHPPQLHSQPAKPEYTALHGVVRRSWGDTGAAVAEEVASHYHDSRGEDVQARYAQLLQRNKGSTPEPTRSTVEQPSSSTMLPPQQLEPCQDTVYLVPKRAPAPVYTPVATRGLDHRSADQECTPDSLELPAGSQEQLLHDIAGYAVDDCPSQLAQEVEAFLQRALQSRFVQRPVEDGSEGAESGHRDEDNLPAELLATAQEGEARFLLAAQAVQEQLENSDVARGLEECRAAQAARAEQPSAARPAAEGTGANIHAMHVHIKGLTAQSTLRAVEVVTAYKLHQSLRVTAEELHQHTAELADSARNTLLSRRKETEAVLRDARAGAVHLRVLQHGLSRVQVREQTKPQLDRIRFKQCVLCLFYRRCKAGLRSCERRPMRCPPQRSRHWQIETQRWPCVRRLKQTSSKVTLRLTAA